MTKNHAVFRHPGDSRKGGTCSGAGHEKYKNTSED
jgi:hypothetical protein